MQKSTSKPQKYIYIVLSTVMLSCLIFIGYSVYKIQKNNAEYEEANKDLANIQDEFINDDGIKIENEISSGEKDKNEEKSEDDKKPIDNKKPSSNTGSNKPSKGTLPNIDIAKLKKRNKDVIGWIYVPDTNINYPILQGKTNNTYLRTNIDGKYSIAGCIFLEALNDNKLYDSNSIIFGHSMRNGTMFHNLRYFKKKAYRESHKKIFIYIDNYIIEYEVTAGKVVKSNDKLYKPVDGNTEAQMMFEMMDKTDKNKVKEQLEKIYEGNQLTLSACNSSEGDDRVIVMSKFSKIHMR